jgi:hypothetical protein
LVALSTIFVIRTELPPFKVSGPQTVAAANPSTFKASGCSERTAGPLGNQAPSDRGKPVVSHAEVETATVVPSQPATLVGFHTQPSGKIKPLCPAAQTRALASLGPQCSTLLCMQRWSASRALPAAPPDACRAGAYTWASSAGTRCGPEVQPGSLRLRETSGLSQGGDSAEPMQQCYSLHWRGAAQALAAGGIAVGSQALHTLALVSLARSAWRAMQTAVQQPVPAERQQPPSAPVAAR